MKARIVRIRRIKAMQVQRKDVLSLTFISHPIESSYCTLQMLNIHETLLNSKTMEDTRLLILFKLSPVCDGVSEEAGE